MCNLINTHTHTHFVEFWGKKWLQWSQTYFGYCTHTYYSYQCMNYWSVIRTWRWWWSVEKKYENAILCLHWTSFSLEFPTGPAAGWWPTATTLLSLREHACLFMHLWSEKQYEYVCEHKSTWMTSAGSSEVRDSHHTICGICWSWQRRSRWIDQPASIVIHYKGHGMRPFPFVGLLDPER